MCMAMNEKLKSILASDLSGYKSIPFWSWNSKLDEGELCRQIDDMHTAGMGGFIIHARTGLQEKYLGEKWFSCISSFLRNLFGPHHFKLNPEPTGVSPDQFEFRGQWEQGKTAKYYTPNYHFVPFGADKIVLITKDGNQSS